MASLFWEFIVIFSKFETSDIATSTLFLSSGFDISTGNSFSLFKFSLTFLLESCSFGLFEFSPSILMAPGGVPSWLFHKSSWGTVGENNSHIVVA